MHGSGMTGTNLMRDRLRDGLIQGNEKFGRVQRHCFASINRNVPA